MSGIIAGAAALVGAALGWPGALAVALLTIIALTIGSSRPAWASCAVAMVAVVLGAWRAGPQAPPVEIDRLVRESGSAVVVTAPVFTGQRQYFAVEPSIGSGSSDTRLPVRVCVTADPYPVVHLGDALELHGAFEVAADLSMRNRAALLVRDCAGSLYAESMRVIDSSSSMQRVVADLRTGLGTVLRRSAPGDAGVLLSGLVTGDDDGFSPERKDAFIQTGTTHLTAVSGSNLALVAGILATVGSATVGRHRASWQIVTILGIWAYAVVSGAHSPSLRAAIVATAAVAAFRVGRRPDFVTLILLAAGAMVLVQPRQIESLGFRLSVVASLALVLVLNGLTARDRTSRLSLVLTATVAAQLATLPVLLPVFGTVSLMSVPANIVAVPLAAVAMPLAALAAIAGSFSPPLGEVIAAPAILAATALIGSVDALAALDMYINVGVPPLPATMAIAATVSILLLLIAGNEFRGLFRTGGQRAANYQASTAAHTSLIERVAHPGRQAAFRNLLPNAGSIPLLPSSEVYIFREEDPLEASTVGPPDAVQLPASEEVGRQLTESPRSGDVVQTEKLTTDRKER
jgi:competence protein ComEC